MKDKVLVLNEKIPNRFLKMLGYKIENDNEYVTHFQKNKFDKDDYNYAIVNEIHIFRKKDKSMNEVCVTPHYTRVNRYDWYNGLEALEHLQKLDRFLAKFTKIVEV